MSKINDGGPAFPCEEQYEMRGDGGVLLKFRKVTGMTLRDYFAAAALTGLLKDGYYRGTDDAPGTAEDAYAIADAMLLARNQEGK